MQWLLFSQRPMTIEEVAEALVTSTSENQSNIESDVLSNELSDPDEILYICSSLVKLVNREQLRPEDPFEGAGLENNISINVDTSDYWLDNQENDQSFLSAGKMDDQVLQLAHFSVRDYLLSPGSILGTGSPDFENQSNMNLAETCVAYLLQFSYYGALTRKFYLEKPMALYAARYWCTYF